MHTAFGVSNSYANCMEAPPIWNAGYGHMYIEFTIIEIFLNNIYQG